MPESDSTAPSAPRPVVDGTDPDGGQDPSGPLDVVAIGSPLVDVLSYVDDDTLDQLGLVKGSMALVDLARSEAIYAAMGPTIEASGGSAANTAAGIACLGGRAGFVGKLADDPLGHAFVHDVRACGVEYTPTLAPAAAAGAQASDGRAVEAQGSGRCLVLVSGDSERTMATHLGVATTLEPRDIPAPMITRSQIVYLEGYLWDVPAAKEAMRLAMQVAHSHDALVAFSLSDPFCVERHQREFLDLVIEEVDVLFGNEEEVTALFGQGSFEGALKAVDETGTLAAITRGAAGSAVVTPGGIVNVEAWPALSVVDTTGAGDLYAAGFLHGLAGERTPRCAPAWAVCVPPR